MAPLLLIIRAGIRDRSERLRRSKRLIPAPKKINFSERRNFYPYLYLTLLCVISSKGHHAYIPV
jgi:hypothetical protein